MRTAVGRARRCPHCAPDRHDVRDPGRLRRGGPGGGRRGAVVDARGGRRAAHLAAVDAALCGLAARRAVQRGSAVPGAGAPATGAARALAARVGVGARVSETTIYTTPSPGGWRNPWAVIAARALPTTSTTPPVPYRAGRPACASWRSERGRARWSSRRAGHATVQDLGRPGLRAPRHPRRTAPPTSRLGAHGRHCLVEQRGRRSADRGQRARRVTFGVARAPLLPGRRRHRPTGSTVDGQRQPARQPLAVFDGCARVHVPAPDGLRKLRGDQRRARGRARLRQRRAGPPDGGGPPTCARAGSWRSRAASTATIDRPPGGCCSAPTSHRATEVGRARGRDARGPDLERLVDGAGWSCRRATRCRRSPTTSGCACSVRAIEQHDQGGDPVARRADRRGRGRRPAAASIVLLRGRMLTAGYPVIAVVATAAVRLDRLGQVAPGRHAVHLRAA